MKKTKIALMLAVCVGIVMTFSACGRPYSSYDLSDYIKVGKYKGLEVAKYTINVTNKEINSEIKSRREAKTETKEVKTGKVKNKNTVVITYKGTINGKDFDGNSGEGVNLTIGSGQFIDGFEDKLIGAEVGETIKFTLSFPKDYSNSDVAGKKAKWTVTIDAKQEEVTPELDAAFIKEDTDGKCKTVAAYKEYIKKDLEKDEKASGIQTQKDYLWNKVLESSEVKKDSDGKEKYPGDEVDKTYEELKDYYTKQAENYSMSYSDFIKQYMGSTKKDFNKQLKSLAKTQVKQNEVVYYIAEKEDIKVSKKEYKAFIKKTLKQYGYTEKSFEKANNESYEEMQGEDSIWNAVYLDKVEDLLLDKAKVVDKVKS